MKISDKQYAQALFELVKDEPEEKRKKTIIGFAKFLVNNHGVFKLSGITKEFDTLWDKEFGIIGAEISSFSILDKKTEKLLQEYIKKVSGAKEIDIKTKTDKGIMGGVVIKYGDKIFDACLRSRLEKLKEKIIS